MDEEIKEIKLENNFDGLKTSRKNFLSEVTPSAPGRNIKKPLLIVLGIILALGIFILVALVLPGIKIYGDVKVLSADATAAKDSFKSQDLVTIKGSLDKLGTDITKTQSDMNTISWTRAVPFFGGYTSDALHAMKAAQYGQETGEIMVDALEPYADLLGLKGKGTFAGGTAEDRIVKAVQTLDKVTPKIDDIAVKVAAMQNEIDQIDANHYPETFQGKSIRPRILEVKSLVDVAGQFLSQARPMVKQLPDLLGAKTEKKYLVLFQNNAELRPTGGFLTAYAVFRVDQGKIHIETSDDIYHLDDTITRKVTPPEPIQKYLNESVWHIRNANFSPDFTVSMKDFMDLYNSSTDKKQINGVIAMDTDVLVKLMDVIGPIPAYGTNFTTQKVPDCGCAQVIWELEKYADQPTGYERGNRKDIIGVLLLSLMQKSMAAPKQQWGPLFQTAFAEMQQKHILFYLLDPDAEKGVMAIGGGGEIKPYQADYLHINDANLGGAKSNLFIQEIVTENITTNSSGTDNNLTIEYRYPRAADNCSLERKAGLCLAGINRDYLRVYLPQGSQIVDASGYESKNQTFDDLGKTVIDGFFTVFPQGVKKIQIHYKTPVKVNGVYKILVQKQGGTDANHYKITVNGHSQEFDLTTDQEVSIPL